jgi:hypothetical protein
MALWLVNEMHPYT